MVSTLVPALRCLLQFLSSTTDCVVKVSDNFLLSKLLLVVVFITAAESKLRHVGNIVEEEMEEYKS